MAQSSQRPNEQAESGPGTLAAVPWVTGALTGALAYAAVYAAVLVLVLLELVLGADVSATGVVGVAGTLLYGAHGVPYTAASGTVDFLATGGAALSVPVFVYYLLPPVALFLAGRAVATRPDAPGQGWVDAAVAGASVAAGYLPLCVLGSFAFTVTFDDGTVASPDLLLAALLAGVAYPVVVGGLGGLVGGTGDR